MGSTAAGNADVQADSGLLVGRIRCRAALFLIVWNVGAGQASMETRRSCTGLLLVIVRVRGHSWSGSKGFATRCRAQCATWCYREQPDDPEPSPGRISKASQRRERSKSKSAQLPAEVARSAVWNPGTCAVPRRHDSDPAAGLRISKAHPFPSSQRYSRG